MKIFADLHLHSHYSRATSNKMNIENLERYGKQKGLNLIGTGDFTHPLWLKELKGILSENDGLCYHKQSDLAFMLQAEIAVIYRQDEKSRRVHLVLFAPSFEVVDQINEFLGKYGKLASDGRPMLTRIDCAQITEKLMQISKDIAVIPAHVWTPWYGLFGSKTGFDKIDDCFKDQTKNIFALETGLSSDPAMNWRLSELDRFALISNSDSHSPWPSRIGREANVFDCELKYNDIMSILKTKDPKKFLYTIEVDPAWGKYHWDGHRMCDVCMSPKESMKNKKLCPVCKKEMTIGVEHRVEELADREMGFEPKGAIPFKSMIPLSELIATVYNTQPFTKKVWEESSKLLKEFGSEFKVLLETPEENLKIITHEKIADLIIKNREGKLKVKPGYDGVYGELVLEQEGYIKRPQQRLDAFIKKK
ncbi:MAG: DNA helicase UvrD [Candidatus Aenigmarchaeota archaeon]|nr:DNA helicase UvrD [Candidatus Aenigmarchaeota archaeon]